MTREALQYAMLVMISSIVLVTLALWGVEKIKHRRAVRSGFRVWTGIDDVKANEPDDDPYRVGMNDKDIL